MTASIKKVKKYNTTISKLFEIILSLNEEQQKMLLKQAEMLPKKEKRAKDRKLCHTKVFFSTSKRVYSSYIENISPAGLFIKTDESMRAGEKILMLFNTKDINKTLKIRGEIAHTANAGLGVKFKDIDPPLANELKNIMAHKQN